MSKKSKKPTPDNSTMIKIAVAIAIILLLWFIHVSSTATIEGPPVNEPSNQTGALSGDFITVHYVGKFENGTLFDTSREELAKEHGLYTPGRDYTPLSVTVGSGAVIQGFDTALVGMSVGDTKTVTIPAAEAYGEYDASKTQSIPRAERMNRTMDIPRYETIPLETFENAFGEEPELNKKYNTEEAPWPYKVIELDDKEVKVEVSVRHGDQFELPGYGWTATVNKLSDEFVTIYHLPKKGHVVETALGASIVTTTDDEVILTSNATVGKTIMTMAGPLKVVEVTKEEIMLDTNHALAGKVLVFDLERMS